MKKILKSSIFLLILSACGKTGPSVGPQLSPPSVGQSKLSAQLIPHSTPNQYSVQLSWSEEASANQILFRTSPRGGRVSYKEFAPETKTWLDTNVTVGESYTYEIRSDEVSNTVTMTIPKDFEYSTNTNLDGSLEGGRLFLSKNVRLYTQGKETHFKFNEIVSDEAFIESFPEQVAAPVNQDGQTSEAITIQAQSLRGKLTVVNRGENGGPGTGGLQGNPGIKGLSGTEAGYTCKPIFASPLYCNLALSLGSPAPQLFNCTTRPTDGLAGGPGSAGGNGGQGRTGGNAGQVTILISELSFDSLAASAPGGMAGVGGSPGTGGSGGEGGDPGNEPHGICPAQRGPSGPNGASGTAGIPGVAGKAGTVCVKTARGSQGDCR